MTQVNVAHCSMQFSDTPDQKRSDAMKIFNRQTRRRAWWITGTEAGGAEGKYTREALLDACEEFGYKLHVGGDIWIAVDRDHIEHNSWSEGWQEVLPANIGPGKHTIKGVSWVQFTDPVVGKITVGGAHYLTQGTPVGPRTNLELNKKLAAAIGKWADEHGRGKGLVFYAGDQNIVDRLADTFLGQADLTSAWDELGRWENTGHGNIDVIASYDRDGRVKAEMCRVLTDREFHLNTDHFLVEATFTIK